MSEQEPGQKSGRQSTPGKQGNEAEGETVASRARQMAERIGRLGDEVVASFTNSDPSQRVARLREVQSEITVGMVPVINWLERRRSADTAALVTRRMYHVLGAAVECARLDIPEYAGGVSAPITGEPAPGARMTGSMVVTAKALATSLMEWANDIESEGEGKPSPTPGKKGARAGVAKKANPPTIPERYRSAVKLWPTFQAEMQKADKRATIKRFRDWLRKRASPVLLDAEFDNWWNNIYSRQLRRGSP